MIRIMFVDDEIRILDGLKRMLRPLRDRWDMTFASGGPEALVLLADHQFDVVVTDMRMPEVDGSAVLLAVREKSPQAVRMVLSGQTDTATAIRTVRIAHQFITKPCDSDTLRRVVERTLALRSLLDDETLRRTVGTVDSLPSVPAVYAALETMLARPDSTLAGISAIIERDSALCAKVLHIVNSSFFGLPRQATRIEDAVNYLGVNILRAVILSHEVARVAGAESPRSGFSLHAHQLHALATAQLARMIMREEMRSLADDAFMAGMLHDIGQLVLAFRTPGQWTQSSDGIPVSESDPSTGKPGDQRTRALVGAYLLGLWGLPTHIVEAVAHHGNPSKVMDVSFDVLTAVHVADALIHEAGASEFDPACMEAGHEMTRLDEPYLAAIGYLDRLPSWRTMAHDLLGQAVSQ